jgi:hypothetical protein
MKEDKVKELFLAQKAFYPFISYIAIFVFRLLVLLIPYFSTLFILP